MPHVVTGEAVAVDLRTAAVPSRLLAGAIDAALQLLLYVGVSALQGAVAPSVSLAADSALGLALLVLVGVGYPVGFEALLRGRTPGKVALGLRVVREDGGPIGFRQALVRGLAGAFLERPGITLFSAGILTMLLGSRGQRIGDLLAGTVVLQERVAVRAGAVATMPPQLAGWAATADLSGLRDDLSLSARQFVARSGGLTDAVRADLGNRLVSAVLAVVTPQPPPGTPGWAVLSAVLAERRRREEFRLGLSPGPGPAQGPAPPLGPPPLGAPLPRPPGPGVPAAAERPADPGPGGFVAPA